ncbi:MAG: ribosome maturation factor RimP [Nitriliruptorales bacterium]
MASRMEGESQLVASLTGLVEPLVVGRGLELVGLEVKGYPGRRLVRLVVDAEKGVDVESCAELSRRVSAVLDDNDSIPSSYTLQVTSPGIERPLRTPRDFARNVGRAVRIWTRPLEDGRREELAGVVTAVSEETVTLAAKGAEVALELADVDLGRVQLPW